VLDTADRLEDAGVSAQVASFHTIKPLDTDYLRKAFQRFALVITVEEHGLIGGFGAAVAEWLADQPSQRAALCRFGTGDKFHHEAGDQGHARRCFGLTAEQMAGRVCRLLRSGSPARREGTRGRS
jgi:transketolase